ncbi:MAG: cell wall hydrolase [Pseudomonadota bacterium]
MLRDNSVFRVIAVSLLSALLVACASMPPSSPVEPASAAKPVVVHSKDEKISVSAERSDDNARHCLALAMYWEARGEGTAGMQAVGAVVLNRVADPRFPSSACDVVKEGGETPPCQFSWWCDGKSDRPTSAAAWSAALEAADGLLSRPYRDQTDGALFFHSTAMRSPWQRQQTAIIGNHVFYR